jgi:hypothetical protein
VGSTLPRGEPDGCARAATNVEISRDMHTAIRERVKLATNQFAACTALRFPAAGH